MFLFVKSAGIYINALDGENTNPNEFIPMILSYFNISHLQKATVRHKHALQLYNSFFTVIVIK